MSGGRCPGCGFSDKSCKKVRTHMLTCKEATRLYKEDPTALLDPVEELARFKLEQGEKREEREAEYQELKAERKAAFQKDLARMEEELAEVDPADPFADLHK